VSSKILSFLYIKKITTQQKTIIISMMLLLILIFGAFMRLYQLGYSSYWIDEGFTLMQARGIAEYGYPLLDSGFVEWKDILVPYVTAPFVKLFGFEHAWVLRLSSAIFSILSIFIGYHLAVMLFSRYTGLIFAFFIASCHWYIAWGQQVRGYAAILFFVLLFFYFLAKYDCDKKVHYIGYAFISVIFAILAKKFAIVLFIPFFVYLSMERMYKMLLILVVPIALVIIFFVYIVFYSLTINPLSYFHFYIFGYLFNYFGIFFILAIIGFFCVIFSKKSNIAVHMSVLSFMIGSLFTFALFVFVSERRYLLMITPFLFLYTAFFVECVARKFQRYSAVVGMILFVSILTVSIMQKNSTILIPQKHYALEYYTPQPNYNKAYAKIIANGFFDNDMIISTNPFMDIIYLGRTNYAIPWSLTGRGNDTTMGREREFHSGARKLYGYKDKSAIDKIHELQKKGNVYIVLDSLASRRMKFELWDDITEYGDRILIDGKKHQISVYYFAHNK